MKKNLYMNNFNHEHFMKIAIEEALKGRGSVEPNPIVGAVIVENGEVVVQAHHEKYGELHAERLVLAKLGRKPKSGAIMYVTLEPCSTEGRTGACTEYLVQSGISEVVLGAIDPNPDHQGRGVDILKKAGIEVVAGVLESECTDLNPDFNDLMQKKSDDKK